MSKIQRRFFFIVVANGHLSIIKSLTVLSPIILSIIKSLTVLSPIILTVFNKNGPIRIQYLSVCQEGADGIFFFYHCDVRNW